MLGRRWTKALVFACALVWDGGYALLGQNLEGTCSLSSIRIDPATDIKVRGFCGDSMPEVLFDVKDTPIGKKGMLSLGFDAGFHVRRSKSHTQSVELCEIVIPFVYQRGCTFAPFSMLLFGSASIHRSHYGEVELGLADYLKRGSPMKLYSTPRILTGTTEFELNAKADSEAKLWVPCTGQAYLLYSIKLQLSSFPGEDSGDYESYLGVSDTSQKLRNDSFWQMKSCAPAAATAKHP